MSEVQLQVPQVDGGGELVDRCTWLVDAHAADDPEQMSAALVELYRHLAALGWVAPPRASLLLRLQAASWDAELDRLFERPRPRDRGAVGP